MVWTGTGVPVLLFILYSNQHLEIAISKRIGISKLCKSIFSHAFPVTSVRWVIRAFNEEQVGDIIIAIKLCILYPFVVLHIHTIIKENLLLHTLQ